MPTQVVELDELVPEEIEFRYQGQSHTLPGDISVETTFRIQKLLVALNEAEQAVLASGASGTKQGEALARQEKLTLEIEELLLGLFREKNPELERLPFGVVGFQHVLSAVLLKLGFGAVALEEAETDHPPKPKAKKRPSRSRPSSSSRSS